MEGAASTWVVGTQVVDFTRTYMSEARRFNFDPDLGWVSKPNLRMDDAFGPGKHLIINSQGYRSTVDFEEKIPEGKSENPVHRRFFHLGQRRRQRLDLG